MVFDHLNRVPEWLASSQLGPLWAILRLIIAMVLGGLIGFERGSHNQIAGFRTHMLIAIGSCLIMEVGLVLAGPAALSGDPARLAAQIVSGIGFLGAGAIIRFGMDVHGLTTAASIWTVSGVGLAVGAGMYLLAVACTLIMFFVLRVLAPISHRLAPRKTVRVLTLKGLSLQERLSEIQTVIKLAGLEIEGVSLDWERSGASTVVRCKVLVPAKDFDLPGLIARLQTMADVEQIGLEALQG